MKTQASNELKSGYFFDTADNEELQVVWVGQSASPQLLLDLFGVDDIFKVDFRIVRVPLSNYQKNNSIFSPKKDRASSPGHPLL